MRNWSIPAGHLFGVDLRIHLTFLFLLFFVGVTEPGVARTTAGGGRAAGLVGIIFASVVLHELGHLLASWRAGTRPKAVILLPIGGVALHDDIGQPLGPRQWKRDTVVALAGPLTNLLAAAIAGAVIFHWLPETHLWAKPYIHSTHLPRSFVWCNVGLALLNLVPAYPLDGGRILRAFLAHNGDSIQATRRAVSIGQTLATVFMLTGMLQYFQGAGPESTWLTLIGFFIFIAAQLEERSAIFHSVLETVHLEDVMLTEFTTLSSADTLEDALDKAVHTLQDDFPVTRGGDLVGVISRRRLLEALRANGNNSVQSEMTRAFEVAEKKESLGSAFRKLTSRNLSLIPVVENQRLIGIITLQNLMHSMALLAESRKLRRETLG
jgi:Zn-dependent protease